MSESERPQAEGEDFELEPEADREPVPAREKDPGSPPVHAPESPADEGDGSVEEPAAAGEPEEGFALEGPAEAALEAIHPAPDGPQPASRLTQAREAREVAEEVAGEAYKALSWDAIKWPARGATFPAVVLLALVAAGVSYLDGGTPKDDHNVRATLQVTIGGGIALGVLAIYGRRILWNALNGDRKLPWFRDRDDPIRWWTAIIEFLTVCVFTQIPLALFVISTLFVDYGNWTGRLVTAALATLGAAMLPIALLGWTARGSVFGALPHRVLKVWRAEPHAARVAAVASVAFVSLLLVSFAFALGFEPAADDHSPLRTAGRIGLGTLRFVAFYAALVSFRVAGLLAHEVPEVKEALQ